MTKEGNLITNTAEIEGLLNLKAIAQIRLKTTNQNLNCIQRAIRDLEQYLHLTKKNSFKRWWLQLITRNKYKKNLIKQVGILKTIKNRLTQQKRALEEGNQIKNYVSKKNIDILLKEIKLTKKQYALFKHIKEQEALEGLRQRAHLIKKRLIHKNNEALLEAKFIAKRLQRKVQKTYHEAEKINIEIDKRVQESIEKMKAATLKTKHTYKSFES